MIEMDGRQVPIDLRISGRSLMRYVQAGAGGPLHLADVKDGRTALTARCGYTPLRGRWLPELASPLGHACRDCLRVVRAEHREDARRAAADIDRELRGSPQAN